MSLVPMLGDWEVPSVTRLETLESRALAEMEIPGRAGNLFQDLNRKPARVVVEGSVFGQDAGQEFLTSVREKFVAGEPLTFVSDIATGTEIQHVLVQQLHVQAAASHADQIDYTLWLVECPPPPPPSDILGGIDTGLLDQAAGMLDTALGAIDALEALGSVPNLSDPTKPLAGALDDVKGAVDQLGEVGASLQGLFG
ncbi:MAG TPA: hypothetical protein VD791_03140 [Burkholderiales bacterium]|nr:hypothetical protein [Burkholderiales bacterium]